MNRLVNRQGTSRSTYRALIPALLAAVLMAFSLASVLFVAQGGFGAGRGSFDVAIFALGMPWALIPLLLPWPQSLVVSDYIVFVLMPLGFNLVSIIVLAFVLGRRS